MTGTQAVDSRVATADDHYALSGGENVEARL